MKTPYRILYKKSWGNYPYVILIDNCRENTGHFISAAECNADGMWTGINDFTQTEVNAMRHLKCSNPPLRVLKLAEWMIKGDDNAN